MSEWSEYSDQELVAKAEYGLKGSGAGVEAMCRLRAALNRHSSRLFWLTIVISVLTAALVAEAAASMFHWVK